MSLSSWLGQIVSKVVNFLGKCIEVFIKAVVSIIENDWNRLAKIMENAFGKSSGILVAIKIINDIVYAVMWERGHPGKSRTGRLKEAEGVSEEEVNKALNNEIFETA
jgi:hypothetical protein